MRQVHYSGDKLFIDYSGVTMPITDQITGELSKAQIFVTVFGASGLTFVHATATQSTKDFISSHIQAFNFYGAVPNILVPDNLKAAVISHKRGLVRLNDSYKDMAEHYKVEQKVVDYITLDGIKLILNQPNITTNLGRKHLVILSFMYATGARVQEVVDVTIEDFKYYRVTTLLEEIKMARLDGSYTKTLAKISKFKLLLLDVPQGHFLRAFRSYTTQRR